MTLDFCELAEIKLEAVLEALKVSQADEELLNGFHEAAQEMLEKSQKHHEAATRIQAAWRTYSQKRQRERGSVGRKHSIATELMQSELIVGYLLGGGANRL